MALSQEEVIKIRKQIGIPEQGFGSATSETEETPAQRVARRRVMASQYDVQKNSQTQERQPGFAERVVGDIKNRAENVGNIVDRKQSLPEKVLQFIGQGAGAINDVIGEGIKSGYDALPDNVKNTISGAGKSFLNTSIGKAGLNALNDGIESYKMWKEDNPRAAANLEATVNIASIIPEAKIADLGVNAVENTAKAGGELALNTVKEGIDIAGNAARKGVEKVADAVTPMEQGVKTVLANGELSGLKMSEKFNKYTQQAEKAIRDYSQPTPLELAGNEASSALKTIDNKVKTIGKQKGAITGELANLDTGNIVGEAQENMRKSLRERVGVFMSSRGDFINVPGRTMSISDKSDLSLLRDIDGKLAEVRKSPNFQKVDDAIDFIQDQLYKRNSNLTIPISSKVEAIIKDTIRKLNNDLKEIGGKTYKDLNNKYSSIIKVRDELNKALGIEGNRGAALMKQLFSPSGTAPRKLFEKIKDLTGIDLVQEATLAKFVMENIGDTRQASLLEQVLKGQVSPSASGIIAKTIDWSLDKIQDPIKKAGRIIDKRIKKE